MPPWRRSASSPAPSGSARSMRSAARSCATPASRSSRSPTAPAILAEVAPWADEAALLRARHGDLAAQGRARRVGRATSPRTRTPGRSRGRSSPTSAAVAASGGLDFDDLILRAIAELEARRRPARPLARSLPATCWSTRSRTSTAPSSGSRCCSPRPANRIFLVGDDDQSIYGWRLADVRRILGLEALLPGLRRVDLEVNYRCPRQVVERAVRLVEHNGERFAKAIRAGPAASGRLVLAPDPSDETVRLERAIRTWPDDGSTRAVLARTNRELLPAVVVALRLGLPVPGAAHRAAARVARSSTTCSREPPTTRPRRRAAPGHARPGRGPRAAGDRAARPRSPPRCSAGRSATRIWRPSPRPSARRAPRLADLRRDDAPLTLATAHATKGLEFDHVVVLGMEAGRFPSARAVSAGRRPRPGLRGGAPSRLRRVDPGASLADAALRPGRPLPVPARGVQPGRARRSAPRPVELADEPVDRIEERLGQGLGAATSRIESLTP